MEHAAGPPAVCLGGKMSVLLSRGAEICDTSSKGEAAVSYLEKVILSLGERVGEKEAGQVWDRYSL